MLRVRLKENWRLWNRLQINLLQEAYQVTCTSADILEEATSALSRENCQRSCNIIYLSHVKDIVYSAWHLLLYNFALFCIAESNQAIKIYHIYTYLYTQTYKQSKWNHILFLRSQGVLDDFHCSWSQETEQQCRQLSIL